MTKKIVAVTACPTGVAHTFMAAEALEIEARKRGDWIKVETRGSVGAKNTLTAEEIAQADVVIIAADIELDLSGFVGKRLYRTSTGAALKKSAQEMDNAFNSAEVYQGSAGRSSSAGKTELPGVYKHLMTGVSHMLPLVVAGGLCIALSFVFGIQAFNEPDTLAAALFQIGGKAAFALMVPLLSTLIIGLIMIYVVGGPVSAVMEGLTTFLGNMTSTNAILLGMLLGAMQGFDLGGPVNKAAYTFGVGLLASHSYMPMAAIMAAGMVPALGMGVATWAARAKFNAAEHEAGNASFILGLCFISEGAIPFAARDPMRVIPSTMVGGAIAGGLSMYFGCTLMAPHGGLFVLAIPHAVEHVMQYLLSIALGTIVCGLMYALLKPSVVAQTV
ncbi:PTS fructose transporter subunit IIBC [Salmonella enterica]|nr:PTS fructose transporter subunit IIBC [Salmonella enterica]